MVNAINAIITKLPSWGYWKCFMRLCKDCQPRNHKKIHRVYCDMKLKIKRRSKKQFIIRERQPLCIANELNHLRALDFIRDTIYDGRPFRTLNVIDEGKREALCNSESLVSACPIKGLPVGCT